MLTASPVTNMAETRSAARDDFAGVQPDSHLDANAEIPREDLAQGTDGGSHLGSCAHSSKRIVLVEHRQAEDGHHGFANDALDGSAMALQDRLHLGKAAVQRKARGFQDPGIRQPASIR